MSRNERTGWRDEALSRRHRRYGWGCPAVDLDFLLLEYDHGKASALIEYKNELAPIQYASHPTYQALIDLGNRADLPVIVARYTTDFSKWKVTPLNNKAKTFIPEKKEMDENGFISLLYNLRGQKVPPSVLENLNVEI